MTTTRTLITAGLFVIAAGADAFAGRLVLEGRYRTSEIISRTEYNQWLTEWRRTQQYDNHNRAAYEAHVNAYRQTRDARYLQPLQQLLNNGYAYQNRMRQISNWLNQTTSVRLVAGTGPRYDRLLQIGSFESVPQFLNRNRHLLGRLVEINARHLAYTSQPTVSSSGIKRGTGYVIVPPQGGGANMPIPGGQVGIFGF